ncbi:hypothetical protein PV10_07812 [Exophiala mesophila]|uniref:Trafficking protein particle complex subunit n=1 Tax=Exophiala mesophila TaxID=212818 RepID=A0A0D1WNC6_EXOME|nr:uncharacterized protein PV10_07812 [Exophiala mesophila]KIV90515.1 hypothetical protein PV10_07812 [Exophiala mesophila]
MVVYSFYIFDRHADCIYKRRWASPANSTTARLPKSSSQAYINGTAANRPTLSAEDDAKLVFGTVFSLRNMVRKLGGEDDSFLSYRTSQYKLHFYETPTNTKFVMLTDTKSGSMRIALQQIYVNCYVEYVVKNPLSPVEHPGGIGVDNELFEASLEQFVDRVLNMS